MKGNVMPAKARVEPEILKSLVTEVKETIAMIKQEHKTTKRFTIVDLWNIRNNSKTIRGRFRG